MPVPAVRLANGIMALERLQAWGRTVAVPSVLNSAPLAKQIKKMELSNSQQKHLRSLAHQLNPVVRIGQHGLSENVMSEIEQALQHHELIKLKITVGERAARDEVISTVLQQTSAVLIQSIGNVAVLFRRNKKKAVIDLPA